MKNLYAPSNEGRAVGSSNALKIGRLPKKMLSQDFRREKNIRFFVLMLLVSSLSWASASKAVAQNNNNNSNLVVTAVSPNPVCAGSLVTITFTATNEPGQGATQKIYDASSTFQVYLSTATGTAPYALIGELTRGSYNFTPPTSNRQVYSGITGTFLVPANIATGTGYKIALGSTAPNVDGSQGVGASPAFTINAIPASAPTSPTVRAVTYGDASANKTLTVTVPAGQSANWYSDAAGTIRVATNSTSYTVTETNANTYTYYVEAVFPASGCGSLSKTAATLTINRKALTIANAAVKSKTYDGTNTAEITGSLVFLVGSDNVTLNGTGTFASVNAAPGIAVTSTSTMGGTAASNYTLTQPTGLTGTITAKPLTVITTAQNKVYDGLQDAVVTLSVNKVATDNVEAVAGGASFVDKNANPSKTVNVTGITLRNNSLNNYTLSSTTSSATAAITPKPLIGTFTAKNKPYDGEVSASVVTRSLTGPVAGDDVSLSGGDATFDSPAEGTNKTVTLRGATLAGTAAGNYTLASVETTTANITAATPLPVTYVSFTGNRAGNVVNLAWTTATEKDNEYFQIEQSEDGRNFRAVGSKVQGAGTTAEAQSYQASVTARSAKTLYFRVKQVDFDGKFDYSKVISVKADGAVSSKSTLAVNPNPTSGHVVLVSSEAVTGPATITLFHSSGRAVLQKQVTAEQALTLDLSGQVPGIYFVQVQTATGKATARIVKQ